MESEIRCEMKHEVKLLQRMRSRTSARDRARSRSLRRRSRSKSREREKVAERSKEQGRPAEKVRSRTSVRDLGRSRSPRLTRSKTQLRQREREEGVGARLKERGAGKERRRSQSKQTRSKSLRRPTRSKSQMRKNEKEASRKYVGEENGRSKSQWKEEKKGRSRDFVEEGRERRKHHRKESRNKSQLRQREPGASRNCEENERSKSQWRRQKKGDGGRSGSLLRRSPLHGMGDGKEGSTHHKRQSRSDSQLAQQEQEDGWRRRGLVGSPLHGWEGRRVAHGERGLKESDREVCSGSGDVKNISRVKLAQVQELVGEVKRLEKAVMERTAKRLKGKKDKINGLGEQGSERNKDLVAHLEQKYDKSIKGEKHVEDEPNSSHLATFGLLESWKQNATLKLPRAMEQIKVGAGLVLVKTLKEENVTVEEVCDSEEKEEKVTDMEEEVYNPEVPTNSSNRSPEPEVSKRDPLGNIHS